MFFAIITHTPIWVWTILAVLIYRGWYASQDRELPRAQLFIVPAIFLALSLDGIGRSFGWHAMSLGSWSLGAFSGGALAWFALPIRMRLCADGHTVFVRGSWLPLAIMLAIFMTKYSTGVALAIHPERAAEDAFVLVVSLIYGVCNGLFLAQLARLLRLQPGAAI